MTDNTKDTFSKSAFDFAAWKLRHRDERPKAPWRWWFSCKPLFGCNDLMPEDLAKLIGSGPSYSEGSQELWTQLVAEGGQPPSSAWLD